MSKVVYWMSVSLDGFVESRDGKIDWTAPDEELHRFFNESARTLGAFLYGRRSYELMASFWPTADQDPSAPEPIAEFARIWRRTPKVVFSKTLRQLDHGCRPAGDDFAAEVAKLKREVEGDLGVSGPTLAASLNPARVDRRVPPLHSTHRPRRREALLSGAGSLARGEAHRDEDLPRRRALRAVRARRPLEAGTAAAGWLPRSHRYRWARAGWLPPGDRDRSEVAGWLPPANRIRSGRGSQPAPPRRCSRPAAGWLTPRDRIRWPGASQPASASRCDARGAGYAAPAGAAGTCRESLRHGEVTS